ncbi:hypothetical protein [Pasteurella multocida]|uniref:hypothetical protein n=1 Tax=Pasteurella multocida TaxID=747 RepID=UPI002B4A7A48|nr:hypothetical protein [Pasteurella multocida]WRK03703.1 hypothetical protein RFF39_03380 [Pasteurella multocida]HDR1800316.1 hypothetical protein [Pasteurella multocida]
MEGKNRNDLVFELYYSYNLESLHYHFNARINNLFITIQLLLSSAIIGDLSRYAPDINLNIFIGLVLSVLSIISFVYRFGEKAAVSKIALSQYSSLLHRYSRMVDDELNNALLETNSIDNNITGAFADIVYKRSSIQMSREENIKLGCYKSFVAWFCGESFE